MISQINKQFKVISIFSVVLFIVGCATIRTTQQGERLDDNSNSIQVVLQDGSIIKFYPDDYRVNPMIDSSYIEGIGRYVTVPEGKEKPFKGRIKYNDIKEIRVVEASTTAKILTPIVIAGVTAVILFVIIPGAWGRWQLL